MRNDLAAQPSIASELEGSGNGDRRAANGSERELSHGRIERGLTRRLADGLKCRQL
jgi:hypothetical protein